MKKISVSGLLVIIVFLMSCIIGCKQEEKHPQVSKQDAVQAAHEERGEKLFHQHCVVCHSDGSRMKDIKSPVAIIHTIRNPKNSMPKFTEAEIPNDAADAIAKYIFFSVLLKQ